MPHMRQFLQDFAKFDDLLISSQAVLLRINIVPDFFVTNLIFARYIL